MEQRGEAVRRPDLRRPVRGRAQTDDRPAGRHKSRGARTVLGRCPGNRHWRRIEAEHRGELGDLVAGPAAHHRASARRHHPGERRTTDIHHEVPEGGRRAGPQRQPVQAVGHFVEHDGALAVRHAREHALGHRTAGDGDACGSGCVRIRWSSRPVDSTASPRRLEVTNRMRMWRVGLCPPGCTRAMRSQLRAHASTIRLSHARPWFHSCLLRRPLARYRILRRLLAAAGMRREVRSPAAGIARALSNGRVLGSLDRTNAGANPCPCLPSPWLPSPAAAE